MKAFIEIVDKEHYSRIIINIKQIVCIDDEQFTIRLSDGSVIYTSSDDLRAVIDRVSR